MQDNVFSIPQSSFGVDQPKELRALFSQVEDWEILGIAEDSSGIVRFRTLFGLGRSDYAVLEAAGAKEMSIKEGVDIWWDTAMRHTGQKLKNKLN